MMGANRRKFIKAAGLAVLGLSVRPSLDALAGEERVASTPAATSKRYAMVVDPAKCGRAEGCTKCIDACQLAHNVPDFGNAKDEIKWVWKEEYAHAFDEEEEGHAVGGLAEQPILVMCNHCDNPPCVRVCPTQATWRREDGIVMFDMHRCIGCRFCMAGCPYGSRSFNFRDPRTHLKEANPDFPTRTKGVVEKCNFCEERLAEGRPPACVEACEEKALVFGDLNDPQSEVRALLASHYVIRRKSHLGTRPQVYYIVT